MARSARSDARTRTGIGHDSHPFGPGAPLRLGGVAIDGAPRLVGHSDGDVALHAVCDALLGAAGLGDLGRLFPADARTPRGIASARAARRGPATGRGGGLAPGDRRPDDRRGAAAARRPPRRDARRDRRRCSGSTGRAVNVKASTGNLDGAEGAGRSISALAVASRRGRSDDAPPARHAVGRDATVRPAARRPRRRLLVRPDRLRPGPHRQLPLVPVRRPARPPPALARLPGDLGHEHHRYRRQDHPRRGRDRRDHRRRSPSAISAGSWPMPRRSG